MKLPWRPPELRETTAPDEIPPSLIELGDIRGDLHCHTTWSDGKASVEEMGRAALARGYEYLAICDHTAAVRVVPGLTGDDVRRQAEEIAAANELFAPFRILRGIECDILPDGTLDLDDDVLAELDWVQISLHAGQRRSAGELTRIVTEAMRNPHASALSHPKGRILNHRPENALDLDAVFEVALETGLAVEINGLPDRLDLSSTTRRRPSRPASTSFSRRTATRRAASRASTTRSQPPGARPRRESASSTPARSASSSYLALLGSVGNGLELDSMRVKPVGRKTVRAVLRELLGLVEDDGVPCMRPLVCLADDRAARDQEREVMKARLEA